jgi:hypothetical protein
LPTKIPAIFKLKPKKIDVITLEKLIKPIVTAHRNCVAVSQMEPQMVMEKFARFVETGNFPSSKCRPQLKIATVTSPQLSSTEL